LCPPTRYFINLYLCSTSNTLCHSFKIFFCPFPIIESKVDEIVGVVFPLFVGQIEEDDFIEQLSFPIK